MHERSHPGSFKQNVSFLQEVSEAVRWRRERPPSLPQALQGHPGGHVCRQARAWDTGVSPGLEASALWGRTYVLISHVSAGIPS